MSIYIFRHSVGSFLERRLVGLDSPPSSPLHPRAAPRYEKNAFAPAFPFGHGLTYGAFSYSGLAVAGRSVAFNVTRTAGAAGSCDTPQLYLGAPGARDDPAAPLKALRHFTKVCGAAQNVYFVVTDADVSVWNAAAGAWQVVHGVYDVYVGASSRDIRLTGQLTV